MFLHRKLDDGDLYFVDNREDRAENVDATFRVDGKAPELWDAATWRDRSRFRIASPMAARQFRCISIPMGTTFVVFREAGNLAFDGFTEAARTRLEWGA